MHKTGLFVRSLCARGVGSHCANIRTENSSNKLNLNNSVQLLERYAFIWNLFQNGYMLKQSIRIPDYCFQLNNIELHSNEQTFNVGHVTES